MSLRKCIQTEEQVFVPVTFGHKKVIFCGPKTLKRVCVGVCVCWCVQCVCVCVYVWVPGNKKLHLSFFSPSMIQFANKKQNMFVGLPF